MLSLPLKDHRTWNRKGFPLGSHILGAECNPIFHNNLLALKKKKKKLTAKSGRARNVLYRNGSSQSKQNPNIPHFPNYLPFLLNAL